MRRRLFNDAEVAWLKNEVPKRSLDETVELFNLAFDRNITYTQLSRANHRYRYGSPARDRLLHVRRPRLSLDDAEIAWLRREYSKRSVRDTLELFNQTFSRSVSPEQLRDANHRYRFGRANQGRHRLFNDVEVAWLKREYPKWSVHETVKLFNQTFNRNVSHTQLKTANHQYRFGQANLDRPRRARRPGMFNSAEVAWLKREIPKWPLHETVKRFNQAFDRDISYDQLRRANSRHKWGGANRKLSRLFNDAELAWLKRVISKWSMDETVTRFNRTFNRDITYEQLRDANHRYRFGRANVKHFHNPPDAPTIERPILSERWRRLGGNRRELWTIMIKVPGPSPSKSHQTDIQQKAHWMPKGRWVWEQANGPIPEGHVVAYLDGDPSNLDLDNLECVIQGAVSIVNMLNWPDGLEAEDADSRREKLLLAHARITAGKRAKEDRR